jgi:hypothetical protein
MSIAKRTITAAAATLIGIVFSASSSAGGYDPVAPIHTNAPIPSEPSPPPPVCFNLPLIGWVCLSGG